MTDQLDLKPLHVLFTSYHKNKIWILTVVKYTLLFITGAGLLAISFSLSL